MRDDAELLRAVAAGDEGALRTLFERNSPWLGARLRRRCDVLADVLQDTFVAAWNGARAWRGDGEVAAWLGVSPSAARCPGCGAGPPRPYVRSPGRSPAPRTTRCCWASRTATWARALRRLSPELRAVVQATALDGLTDREAAQLLGLPLGTVKGRLRKAKARSCARR